MIGKIFYYWFFIAIGAAVCTYFGLAFIAWEFDPANWDKIDRAFMVIWSMLIASIMTASEYY